MESVARELREACEAAGEEVHTYFHASGGVVIAYAPARARMPEEVEVLAGREIRSSPDNLAARITLTAMRFDPGIRSVAVLAYEPAIISAAEGMLMEICSFDRSREPPGIATIDWGVAFCCEKTDGVPDLIFDTGAQGKDPLIRILGENPTSVYTSLNRIITRIKNTNS